MSIPTSKYRLHGPAFAALTAGLLASWSLMHIADARPAVVVSNELRAAPSPTAPVVEQLEAATSLPFLLRRGQWLAVRNGDGLAWVLAVQGLDPDAEQPRDGDSCRSPGGDVVEPRLHDRVTVAQSSRLRSHLGRDLVRDHKLVRGTKVYVHATARDGEWVLVEAPASQLGWVRRCEIDVAARPGAAGDDVVVTRAGSLHASRGGAGRKVASLSQGLRLRVEDRDQDWVQLTADDGATGWFPADRVRWAVAEDRDPDSLWQTGLEVDWPCDQHVRGGGAHKVASAASSVRCGDHLRIIRGSGTEKRPQLLVVADDGRWGWIHEPVTLIVAGTAVVRADDARAPTDARARVQLSDRDRSARRRQEENVRRARPRSTARSEHAT